MTKPANPLPHPFEPSQYDRDRCAKCDRQKHRPWHDTARYKFPEGTRVRVKDHLKQDVDVPDVGLRPRVPEWATYGTVVSNPGPNSDYYLHPKVRWDSDGRQRHVPDAWLERIRTDDRNYIAARCSCGRTLRMAPTVLRSAPVVCGNCNTEFQEKA